MRVIDGEPLSAEQYERVDAYWRAANYVSVGQIYLLDNPLLREPLTTEHIKPRLLQSVMVTSIRVTEHANRDNNSPLQGFRFCRLKKLILEPG